MSKNNCCSPFVLLLSVTLAACASDAPTATPVSGRETLLWHQPTLFAEIPPRVDQHNIYLYDAANVLHAVARSNGTERWNTKVVQPLATNKTGGPNSRDG